MAQVKSAPWVIEWGAVVIGGISNVDVEVEQPINEEELVDGSTMYFEGNAKAAVTIDMRSQDVTELAKALADYHVANGANLANGTAVTAANGLIEISNNCSATTTTAALDLKSCDGNVRLHIESARALFENYSVEDNGDIVQVKFASTATDTIAWIGNQA